MKLKIKKSKLYGTVALVAIALLLIMIIPFPHTMDMKRAEFVSMKEDIQDDLLPHGKYRCCLEKPCTYCIEKSPGHGEGAACNCLDDVVNGVHPCGECIGEILEGHGNPLLSEYFARAIAEKTGSLEAMKQIISEKYDMPIENQI